MKPLYMQMIDYVKKKIKDGEWKEGYMLPTEVELCQMFQVSRQTVRTSLLQLVNEGYLSRTKGRGTFVTTPKVIESTTIFLESFSQEMNQRGFAVKTEVLELRALVPPRDVAAKLELKEGEEVVKLKRLRYQEGNFENGAIVVTTSWFPIRFINLLKYDFEGNSLHDVLKEEGTVKKSAEKNINACLIEGKSCHLLGIPENSVAISIASQTYDQDGRLMEYSESLYPAERNQFVLKIKF